MPMSQLHATFNGKVKTQLTWLLRQTKTDGAISAISRSTPNASIPLCSLLFIRVGDLALSGVDVVTTTDLSGKSCNVARSRPWKMQR
jgi:hypothetical protein